MPHALVTAAAREEYRAARIADKLTTLLDMSLDDCFEILAYSIEEAMRVPSLLNAKIQTHRAVIHACVKLGIEQSRERTSAADVAALEELARRLAGGGDKSG